MGDRWAEIVLRFLAPRRRRIVGSLRRLLDYLRYVSEFPTWHPERLLFGSAILYVGLGIILALSLLHR